MTAEEIEEKMYLFKKELPSLIKSPDQMPSMARLLPYEEALLKVCHTFIIFIIIITLLIPITMINNNMECKHHTTYLILRNTSIIINNNTNKRLLKGIQGNET